MNFNLSQTDVVESRIFRLIEPWLDGQVQEWTALGFVDGSGDPLAIGNNTVETVIGDLVSDVSDRTVFNGRPAFGNRSDKFNLFTKYTFTDSFVRGFSVGGGYRYQGGNPVLRFTDSDEVITGPSYGLVDLVFGYRNKIFNDKVTMNLQVNVSNALDNDTRLLIRVNEDLVPLRNSGLAPQAARFTASFSF